MTMMPTGPRIPPISPKDHLHAAICLLALITARPANLDELISGKDTNNEWAVEKVTADHDAEDESDEDFGGPEIIRSDDEQKRSLHILRNGVLDRLAETLARYKSDPRTGGGAVLDPKHVSSTMMIMYNQESKVEILCSKNEGLNQGNSTDDTEFLHSWKDCMERISKAGSATENDKASMLDLILNYQRPRIDYYLTKLRDAFRFKKSAKQVSIDKRPTLSDEWLQKLPIFDSRIWIDDHGNKFKFSAHSSNNSNNISRAVSSAQSLRDMDNEVGTILKLVEEICALDPEVVNSSESGIRQEALLKELLPSMFAVWKSARFQASMKARLRERFQHIEHAQKRQNGVMTALKFLCRIYYGLVTFIEAAESMPMFQSIECIPIFIRPTTPRKKRSKAVQAQQTPIQVATSLGLDLRSSGWLNYLQKKGTMETFKRLRAEKCHVHAEIQLLSHHKTFLSSRKETGSIHPYIGCSKRCCLLCWLFIRTDASFQVRGSHETVMNRWEIPPGLLFRPSTTQFHPVTHDFFTFIKAILQNLFDQSFPLRPPELLAQSSAALSTTQTVLDREKSQMEKSQLSMRRMMMMPSVMNDGILTIENHENPGYVSVIGGSLKKVKEMTFEEAEIFKEDHIRFKFGLEGAAEMPPKQQFTTTSACHRCRRRSNLHCGRCRMRYCSRSCQRKEWKRHVFICGVGGRPDGSDYLGIILSRWSSFARKDEEDRMGFFHDLYSDGDFCRVFGFINCYRRDEVASLICLYRHLIHEMGKRGFQKVVEGGGDLGYFMAVFAAVTQYEGRDGYSDCPCLTWFLERHSIGFVTPNWEGGFVYQISGLRQAEHVLLLETRDDDINPLSPFEKGVLKLYSILYRDFNNIPDSTDSFWFEFGFCFCRNYGERKELARLYIRLVEDGALIGEIAEAYKSGTLSDLMKARGQDLSFFEENGILFHKPDIDEMGIYRLVAEVHHTLSGCYCYCWRPKPNCHPKFETHLSVESDGDYGFHGTNPWERWQLLNFYRCVFQHPRFDARAMQEAKRYPEAREAVGSKLERYLDDLIPDFKRKIGNNVLGDAMFPKVKAKVRFPNGKPTCLCVVHDVLAPEGLCWATPWVLARGRGKAGGDEDVELRNLLDGRGHYGWVSVET